LHAPFAEAMAVPDRICLHLKKARLSRECRSVKTERHFLLVNDTLHFLANHLVAPDRRRLGGHLPVEWIEQAIECTEGTCAALPEFWQARAITVIDAPDGSALYPRPPSDPVCAPLGRCRQVKRHTASVYAAPAR
jgi:hypothetical protein